MCCHDHKKKHLEMTDLFFRVLAHLIEIVKRGKNKKIKKSATVLPSSNLDPAVEGRQNDPVQEENSVQHVTDLWLGESGCKKR